MSDTHIGTSVSAALLHGEAPLPPDFVERKDAKKMTFNIVVSPTSTYEVIVGNRGTGKTTLVQEVARENTGITYVLIERIEDTSVCTSLVESFATAISWEEPRLPWSLLHCAKKATRSRTVTRCQGASSTA